MPEQLLRNPEIEPTSAMIAEGLGAANGAYEQFKGGLKEHDIQMEYRYYPDGKAWLGKGLYRWTGARGGQKEITACWLSIWDGFFRVTFFIPEKARAQALSLPLENYVRGMIEDAKQMGKLKFFPLMFDLSTDELLDQVYMLMEFMKVAK